MDERVALLNTEKILSDDHVPRRRYRKKLRQPLDDSNDDGLD